MKKVTAADLGGAAFDSNGQIEGRSGQSTVWVMAGISPETPLYISLHTTRAGADQRLAEKAAEWGVPISKAGEVQPCDVENP